MHHLFHVFAHIIEILIHRLKGWIFSNEFNDVIYIITSQECKPCIKFIIDTFIMKFVDENINRNKDALEFNLRLFFFHSLYSVKFRGVFQGLGSIRYQGDMVKKVYFPRQIYARCLSGFAESLVSHLCRSSLLGRTTG